MRLELLAGSPRAKPSLTSQGSSSLAHRWHTPPAMTMNYLLMCYLLLKKSEIARKHEKCVSPASAWRCSPSNPLGTPLPHAWLFVQSQPAASHQAFSTPGSSSSVQKHIKHNLQQLDLVAFRLGLIQNRDPDLTLVGSPQLVVMQLQRDHD